MAPSGEDGQGNNRKLVSLDVKDTFFDDPFFRDWWNDFDLPKQNATSLQRQISSKFIFWIHAHYDLEG